MEIKTTKDGKKIEAENGFIKVDGRFASIMKIPKNLMSAAMKVNPSAVAMVGNILLTQDDLDKVKATRLEIKGISKESLKKLQTAKNNEDINYIHSEDLEDTTFDSSTDGQFNIYKD
jgi:hypothetical protein